MIDKQTDELIKALKGLLKRIDLALDGTDILTAEEIDLINDLHLWYEGYKTGKRLQIEKTNFQPGDVASLKCNDLPMVVDSLDLAHSKIVCVWHTEDGLMQRSLFNKCSLKSVE